MLSNGPAVMVIGLLTVGNNKRQHCTLSRTLISRVNTRFHGERLMGAQVLCRTYEIPLETKDYGPSSSSPTDSV